MIVTIRVTEIDIENGEPGSCAACPIAKSVRRVLSDNIHPYVFHFGIEFQRIEFSSKSTRAMKMLSLAGEAPLPDAAFKFMERFDSGSYRGGEFSFEIDIPRRLLRQDTIQANLVRQTSLFPTEVGR